MDHLPIFCQLRDRDCLIVGGGDVAERKARLLLDAGARLTVNALAFIPQFTAWADAGMLTLVEGPFDESLLDTCWLAIAATDDDALNQRVSEAAEARRIFCNVVDAPKAASFIMPSIIDRSPLMVAVSSGGTSPVLARLLREKLESLLPLHLGQVAKYAGQLRGRVKQQFATMGERRRFWEKLFVNDRLAQSLANNDQKAITETTEQLINEPLDHRGEVVLPGLIAFHLYQDLPKADMAYPTLVNNVLPVPMVGFFGAVLFGAVISTFNGFLNSASTLFSMGIYRRIINQNAEPQQLVTVGRKFGFFIAIVSVLVAPWIANAPQGLYSWMKQLNGIYNVPLVTIIIMGFFFPRIPALAAKVAMGIGIISYITINYLVKFDFHFLYVLACTFCINVVVMLVIGFIKPRATPFTFKDAFAVDMKPWKNVKIASIGILFAMIGVYAGLAEFGGYGTRWLAMISYFIAAVVIVYLIFDSWRHRHDPAVTFTPDGKDSL